jgi:hypothetical protein
MISKEDSTHICMGGNKFQIAKKKWFNELRLSIRGKLSKPSSNYVSAF